MSEAAGYTLSEVPMITNTPALSVSSADIVHDADTASDTRFQPSAFGGQQYRPAFYPLQNIAGDQPIRRLDEKATRPIVPHRAVLDSITSAHAPAWAKKRSRRQVHERLQHDLLRRTEVLLASRPKTQPREK